MILSNEELKSVLTKKRLLSEKDLQSLIEISQDSGLPLAQTIIEKGVLRDQDLGKIIAEATRVPFVELSKKLIKEDVFKIIPEKTARKNKTIVFDADQKTVKLGMADPSNSEIIAAVEKKTAKKAVVYFATETDIKTTLQMYQKNLQEEIDRLVEEEIQSITNLTNDAPIIKIVNTIITYAYREKASDIHIEPEEENILVRFRIDSILHRVLILEKNLLPSIVTRIKVLGRLRTDEHQDAQDGKIRMKIDDETLDIRVSVIPTTEGEKVVLRLLSSNFRSFSLPDLGMNEKDLEKVNEAAGKSWGMILSTGPTGSGKTTSIYALLKIINTPEKNITTIEDPVEYRIKGVNHIPVNPRVGLTFVNGLRSILRQDPNVIFVGEIRDSETASLAINASLTGHLVFSTLHTNDAAGALPRLIDLKVEPFLLASTINVIIAQRLVRKICTVCRKKSEVKKSEILPYIPQKTLSKYFGAKTGISAFKGSGCQVCHMTGYSGRVGIFEVLKVSQGIRDLILERRDASTIRKKAIEEGMTPLFEDGLKKVVKGVTSIEELLRVIKVELG